MEIIKNRDGERLGVEIKGRLDTTTAPQLDEVVKNDLDGVNDLIFKLDELDYISSAGLRVLLAAQKVMNKQGKMIVTGVKDDIMEVFEITGFADILDIQ